MTAPEPPAALLLVHGAGSGPWVFADWTEDFSGLEVAAVDLQAGLDVANASHGDYADRIVDDARALPQPVCLCGWSMGGLAVLQAAERLQPHSVVLLETSPPAEVQGTDETIEPEQGTFDPEDVYGRFPPGMPPRPESSLARGERKRGISVPRLPCPSLVVSGSAFREDRGTRVALLYGSDELRFPDLDHWGLVRDRRVRDAIREWLGVQLNAAADRPQIA